MAGRFIGTNKTYYQTERLEEVCREVYAALVSSPAMNLPLPPFKDEKAGERWVVRAIADQLPVDLVHWKQKNYSGLVRDDRKVGHWIQGVRWVTVGGPWYTLGPPGLGDPLFVLPLEEALLTLPGGGLEALSGTGEDASLPLGMATQLVSDLMYSAGVRVHSETSAFRSGHSTYALSYVVEGLLVRMGKLPIVVAKFQSRRKGRSQKAKLQDLLDLYTAGGSGRGAPWKRWVTYKGGQ
jgi:hypothetical protein